MKSSKTAKFIVLEIFPLYYGNSYHKLFPPSKEVAKVNMEQVTRCGHHNVVIVSVTNTLNRTNDKHGHTLIDSPKHT